MVSAVSKFLRDRCTFPHIRLQPTRWIDNDSFGHMNNSVHYQFFDTAVNLMLRDWGAEQAPLDPFRFIVAETGCRYFAEMRYPCVIATGLRIAHVGRSSVRYELGLFAGDDEHAAAAGFLVHVHVSTASNRPSPIPEELRAVMDSFMAIGAASRNF